MKLEQEIISSLNGQMIWNGVKTDLFHPLSILDLMCIHNKNYDEINICTMKLISCGYVFLANDKYHIKHYSN